MANSLGTKHPHNMENYRVYQKSSPEFIILLETEVRNDEQTGQIFNP